MREHTLIALGALLPGKQDYISTGKEAQQAPEKVWTLWRRDISLAHMGN
jgi:hypothetical protein